MTVSLRPTAVTIAETFLQKLLLVGLLAPLHELHAIMDELLGRLEDL